MRDVQLRFRTNEQVQAWARCNWHRRYNLVSQLSPLDSSIEAAMPTTSFSVLFVLTTACSIYGVSYHRAHGSLPAWDTRPVIPFDAEEADNYAFSAHTPDKFTAHEELQEMRPDHSDEDEHGNDNDHYTLHSNPEDDHHPNPNPNRPFSWAHQPMPELSTGQDFEPLDTSYHGGGQGHHYNTTNPLPQPPPSPLSNRVPSPHYETTHSNESYFVGGLHPLPQPPPSPLSNRVPSPNYDTINSNSNSNPYATGLQPLPHQPPSPLSNRAPSPRYDTYDAQPNESYYSGGSHPHAPPLRQPEEAENPFGDGLVLSHEPGGYAGGSGKLDFPEGEYGR